MQSPTGRPPLASPGQAPPPQRSASERALQPGSASSTPGKAPPPASMPVPGAAPAGSKGMPIKGDRGRFKVYEVGLPLKCLTNILFCTTSSYWAGQLMLAAVFALLHLNQVAMRCTGQ